MIKLAWCEVWFSYDREHGITVSYIDDKEKEDTYVGVAVCSEHDIFDKNKGRKVALTSALKFSEYPREKRKEIWNAYFVKRNGKFD